METTKYQHRLRVAPSIREHVQLNTLYHPSVRHLAIEQQQKEVRPPCEAQRTPHHQLPPALQEHNAFTLVRAIGHLGTQQGAGLAFEDRLVQDGFSVPPLLVKREALQNQLSVEQQRHDLSPNRQVRVRRGQYRGQVRATVVFGRHGAST